jgi:hypothetical protein
MWDQLADAEKLKRQLAITEPIVEVLSNDPRLADLRSFEHTAEEAATGTESATPSKPKMNRRQQAAMFGGRRGRR